MRQTKTASTAASPGSRTAPCGAGGRRGPAVEPGVASCRDRRRLSGGGARAPLRDVLDLGPARRSLLRERLVRVFVDCALVGVLVASTGGADSPFFPLYLLAALEIAWIETRPKVAVATAVLVAGYPVAVVVSGGLGDLASTPVALRPDFMALFCVVVTFLASEIQGIRKLAVGLSSTLANEIDRVESDEGLISEFGPVMKVLSLEGILGWTVEAAHAVGGGPYAHVAALKGNHHSTLMEGDFDVCPSWWHPAIQRLVLQSTPRGRHRAQRRGDPRDRGLHGRTPWRGRRRELGGGDRRWRGVRRRGGACPEAPGREVCPCPGGRRGRPWRAGPAHRITEPRVAPPRSAAGALLRQAAYDPGDAPGRLRDYARDHGQGAGDALLRRIGQRLGDGRQRVFRYGDEEFVVVLSGSGEGRARRVALALQQHVSEESPATCPRPPSAGCSPRRGTRHRPSTRPCAP